MFGKRRVIYVTILVLTVLLTHVLSRPGLNSINVHPRQRMKSEEVLIRKRRDEPHGGCSLAPFNVTCHGRCPRPDQGDDWDNLVKYHNCSQKYEGSKFHCAKVNTSGKYKDVCAQPISCHKGKKPILIIPEGHTGHADVICEWCSDERYNPDEAKMSNTYPYCLNRRRECPSSEGQIECDKVTGVARHWTESKCRCNIKENHLPQGKIENTCRDDYDLVCVPYPPCAATDDGKKKEYLSSNYSCAPVCGEGYHPRTLDNDECIPIESDGSSTVYPNVTSVHTVEPVTNSTKKSTTPKETKNDTIIISKVAEGSKGKHLLTWCLSTGGLVLLFFIVWFLVRRLCLKWKPRKKTTILCSCRPSSCKNDVDRLFCYCLHPVLRPPEKPVILDKRATSDKSIYLKVEQPLNDEDHRCVKKYKIYYKNLQNGEQKIEKIKTEYNRVPFRSSSEEVLLPNYTDINLKDLEPSTQYEFKVLANGKYRDDPFSDRVNVTTFASGYLLDQNVDAQPRVDVQPDHDAQPGGDAQPGEGAQPRGDVQRGEGAQPRGDVQRGEGAQPRGDMQPSHDVQPGDDDQAADDANSDEGALPGDDAQPGHDGQPGSDAHQIDGAQPGDDAQPEGDAGSGEGALPGVIVQLGDAQLAQPDGDAQLVDDAEPGGDPHPGDDVQSGDDAQSGDGAHPRHRPLQQQPRHPSVQNDDAQPRVEVQPRGDVQRGEGAQPRSDMQPGHDVQPGDDDQAADDANSDEGALPGDDAQPGHDGQPGSDAHQIDGAQPGDDPQTGDDAQLGDLQPRNPPLQQPGDAAQAEGDAQSGEGALSGGIVQLGDAQLAQPGGDAQLVDDAEPGGDPHPGDDVQSGDDAQSGDGARPRHRPLQQQPQSSRFMEEVPEDARIKPLSEIDINRLACHFGKNWKALMIELGLTYVRTQQIEGDNKKDHVGCVAQALFDVKAIRGSLTLDMIYKAAIKVKHAFKNIDWDEIIQYANDELRTVPVEYN